MHFSLRTYLYCRIKRALSLTLVCSILFYFYFPLLHVQSVHAASLNGAKNTISISSPGLLSNHTLEFMTPTGVAAGETIEIIFDTAFSLPGALDFTDVDLAEDGSDEDLLGTCSGTTWGVSVVPASKSITFTSCTGTIAAGATTTIEIGTNATFGTTGDQQITNPVSSGTYSVNIGGSMTDEAEIQIAIIESVNVSALVGVSLTFTILGVGDGLSVNGSPTTTATTTLATSIPFETLTPNVSKVLAQDLSVITNATNGFVVTLVESANLTASNGADIDLFIDGASTSPPTAWVPPAGTPSDEKTYGHFGITSEDADLNGNEFGTDLWAGNFDNPRQIFSHTGPADGSTPNIGATRVGFQIEISPLQEAGEDYTTTLTYVATPSF